MEAPPATPKLSTYERLLQQEAEKAEKKRQAAGGDAAQAAPKPKARARAASVTTRGGTFSFVAAYLSTPYPAFDYSVKHYILPVNIPKLASKPAPMVPLAEDPSTLVPMYEAGSADRQSIVFKVQGAKPPKNADGNRSMLFTRLASDKVHPKAILSTREAAEISERKSGADLRTRPLEPFMLVQVNNAVFERWTKKDDATKQGHSLGCDSLQPDVFADFNEQPLEWRIAQILRSDSAPSLLKLDEVRALGETYRNDMATVTGDSKEVRKKKKVYMAARYGNLIPMLAFSANRAYKLNDLKGAKLRRKTVVPEIAPLPMMGDESSLVVRTTLEHIKPDIFKPGTTVGSMKIPDKMALSANFAVHVYDMKAPDPTVPVFAQYYPDVFVMAGSMVNFPVAFPEFIQQVLRLHPIPFHVVAEANLATTLEDPMLDMPDKDFPGGIVHTNTFLFHAETAGYLRRQGIPCSRKLLLQRYGRDYGSIDTAVGDKKYADALRSQRATVFDKWLPKDDSSIDAESLLMSVGCAGFDGPKILSFPKEDAVGISYYALNLFEFSEAPPTEEKKGLLRPAVKLTPAEGDAFLLKNLPRPPNAPADWVQKALGGMPYYLFFAVRDEQPINPAVMEDITTKLRDMMFPAEGPLPGADKLPATVGDLRRRITQELLGLPADSAPPAAQGVKRPREEEEEEPVAKRPRLLELMGDDPMDGVTTSPASKKKEKSADDDDDDEGDFDE